MSRIAQNAIKVMPKLAQLRLVRAWGSLRVMSPDGLQFISNRQACQVHSLSHVIAALLCQQYILLLYLTG